DVQSGAVLTANAAASELYGYTHDEFLKLNQLDLTLEPEETVKARLAQQPFTALRWHKKRDGTQIRVDIASRFVELDGRPVGIAAIRDISDKQRMEEALQKSEEKFRKVFLTSPLLMCISRLDDGLIVEANDAFERLSGYLREEAIGRTTLELGLWNPQQRAELVRQVRAAGLVRNQEIELRTKTGERKTVLFSAETVDVGGEPMLISSVIDITEQRRSDEQVRSLATAVEQAGEAVVITDAQANIRYCNPAFESITGYRFEEVVNRNPRILKSGSHAPDFYRKMWAEIMAGGTWKGRLTNRRKDGSLYEEESTISPIRSADGAISGFVAMKQDVTAQVHLERQLAQAQKMESVGRLAGGIAHDFNNLLTVINGYGELLAASIPEENPLGAYAREVCKAGERAASLTRQLLAFSRKQAVQFKPLDLDALIRDSENMLRRLIGENISLATSLGLNGGRVMADSGQLHQVVMNLVLNSRDAMPTGGLIQIETTRVTLDEADLAEPNAKPGTWFVLTVTDTGFGMDEATRQRVFEPFFTSKKDERGTGLGLATVYGVVAQMGGWIDVWSQVDIGTTFKLFVPPAARTAFASPEHEPAPGRGGAGIQQ
ncbi:MAG: PAS domain S-box protein, partial [Bryobacterales bacterium]|nr:PAS domain S-box protein [Bryobacterales bacterium]